MKQILYLILTLSVILGTPREASLHAENYTFRALDEAKMLYGSSVNTILEDYQGYLWIATTKGLYRYDGYTLMNAAHFEATQLKPSEQAINLQEDAEHHLWITRPAASEYNVLSPQRVAISIEDYMRQLHISTDDIYLMHVDRQGDLWRVTADSVCHYSFADQSRRTYAIPTLLNPSNQRIWVESHVSETCPEGTVYIIDGNKLLTLDCQSGRWLEETMPIKLPTLGSDVSNVMQTMACLDSQGRLWIYSLFSEDILLRTPEGNNDALSPRWRHIKLPTVDNMSHIGIGHRSGNSIRFVTEDPSRGMWIATDHRGLFLYQPERDQFQQFTHDAEDANTITTNNVNSLLIDSHGTLWLGYFKVGISYCHSRLDYIHPHTAPYGDVTAILVDEVGNRWLGTDGNGLWCESSRPDKEQRDLRLVIPDVTVADMQRDGEGHVWVATYDHGLCRVSPDGRHCETYNAESGELPHDGASRLTIDGQGRLWVCSTLGTLYCYNPATHTHQTYTYEDGNLLFGDAICYNPTDNTIILATYWRLWIHDLNTDSGQVFMGARDGEQELHADRITNILVDTQKLLVWMSHDLGITVWDTRADTLYLIRSQQISPLASPTEITSIQAMRFDNQQNVWLSTLSGLSVIQTAPVGDGRWAFHPHAIPAIHNRLSVLTFNPYSAATTLDNNILFGSTDGYCEFECSSMLDLTSQPVETFFSTVMLGDSIITLSASADIRSTDPNEAHNLPLIIGYDHQPLTINFYTGNPLDASDVTFSYRIRGLNSQNSSNDGWEDSQQNSITLHSLSSGKYMLELKTKGMNGEWSKVNMLPIYVTPPWWNSSWMRLIYILLILLFGGLLIWGTLRSKSEDRPQTEKIF